MFERPNTIKLSGEDIPIKCDMVVLEKIQEKYKSITAYDKLIYTFVPELDDDGNLKLNEDGMMIGTVANPADLKPLFELFFWMAEEGREICKELGEDVQEYTDLQLKRMIDMPPYQFSDVLHEEFLKAFERKN